MSIERGANLENWGEALSSGGSVVRFPGCNGGSKFLTLIDLSINRGAHFEKSASPGFRSHLDLSKNTRDVSRDQDLMVAAVKNVQKTPHPGVKNVKFLKCPESIQIDSRSIRACSGVELGILDASWGEFWTLTKIRKQIWKFRILYH